MKSRFFAYALTTMSFAAGSAAAISGCSSADATSTDESNDEYRKKPKGTENWSNLTVQLPTGTCQPGGSCSKPLGVAAAITIDGSGVALGSKNRIKPGDHTVGVNGVSAKVTLTAGQDKTLTLPVAHRKCVAANLPNVTQTDFGASVTVANAACPSSTGLSTQTSGGQQTFELFHGTWDCVANSSYPNSTFSPGLTANDCPSWQSGQRATFYSVRSNGTCRNSVRYPQAGTSGYEACLAYVRGDYSLFGGPNGQTGQNFADYDLAYVPGSYDVVVGSGTSQITQNFTLREGDTKEISVNLPVVGAIPTTFATKISFDDPRDLPDAATATITSSCGERGYTVPATTTTALQLKAFQNTSCTYTLNAGGRQTTLDQTQTNNIKLNRIDVDHPEITREDGSKYTVTGQYEIYFGGNRVVGPVNTNTGVDLLPGTYELVTKYNTADGPQVERETVQL